MSGECGPSASDPVLHLGGFLIHECGDLFQVFGVSFAKNHFEMHPVDLDFFRFVYVLIGQNFRICLGELRALALLYVFLKSAIMNTSSAQRRLDMQSLFSSLSCLSRSKHQCRSPLLIEEPS